MKKYRVHLNYYAMVDDEVEAESEEEAKELVLNKTFELEDFDFELNDVDVYEEE